MEAGWVLPAPWGMKDHEAMERGVEAIPAAKRLDGRPLQGPPPVPPAPERAEVAPAPAGR